MKHSELAAVTKFVMRDRQHLGVLRVREGVITLEQLYLADEIRPVNEIKPSKRKVDRRELQMAQQLIEDQWRQWQAFTPWASAPPPAGWANSDGT
jgi:non-homologous end joining protein Ku